MLTVLAEYFSAPTPSAFNAKVPKLELALVIEQNPPLSQRNPVSQQIVKTDTSCVFPPFFMCMPIPP